MGKAALNKILPLRNQQVIAAENFGEEENLSFVLIPTMSKDMDEQLKLAYKVLEVVDRANRMICVTLLRYNVDKPESFYAAVRLIVKKKDDEKFHQIVYVNYELDEFIYLLDVMNSLYDKVLTNQPIWKIL